MRSLLFTLPLLAACAEPLAPPAPLLAVPDEPAARGLIERFFRAYVAADTRAALALLCEQDPDSQAAYRRFLERSQREGSSFRVTRFEVRAIEAGFRGKEPYFFIEVAFPAARAGGEVTHAYRIRAREGCIDRFLGDGPSRAEPPASPPPAPVAPADGVIEL